MIIKKRIECQEEEGQQQQQQKQEINIKNRQISRKKKKTN